MRPGGERSVASGL